MRNLKSATIVLAWLSGAVLAQEIRSRGLSDTLNSILGPGNEEIAKQIEGQLAAGGGQQAGQPVITTYIIDGPKGAFSTVMPVDGVFVTTSIASTTQGAILANTSVPIASPAVPQPITALPSAIHSISTASIPPPAAVVDSTVQLTQTTQIHTTVTPPAAPSFANGSPPPAKQLEPPNAAPAPAAPPVTGLPSVVIVTQAPPAASHSVTPIAAPPAASPPSPPAPSSSSPPAGPGALGLTTGKGKILADGTCGCSCNCDGAAFPAMPAAAPPAGMPVPVANGTTLQTIITPPTSSVALPSTLLVDTNTPPPPPGAQVSSTSSSSAQAGSASTTTSVSAPEATSSAAESTSAQASTTATSDTTAQSTTAPAQETTETAASSIRFSLISDGAGGAQVTAAPDLSQAQPQLQPGASIDISKFTLVSSLILGNLAG